MTARLILVRHGETAWNEAGRYQGWDDPPLSARGRVTARGLAQLLDGRVPATAEPWSSDLTRAVQTARLAFAREPRVDARLRELDFGAFAGRTWAENEARFGARFLDWVRDPHGLLPPFARESLADFEARVRQWCDEEVVAATGVVVAVTHGGVIRALVQALTGLDIRPANGEAVAIGWASPGREARLERLGIPAAHEAEVP